MRFLSPARVAGGILLVAAVVLVALYVIPSNAYYVFVPDSPHALAPIVKVTGHQPRSDAGGIYFVDVRFRKARLLESLLKRPFSHGATLEPAEAVLGGASESQQQKIDANEMDQSQQIAKALALNRLGYHVRVTLPTVVVRGVEGGVPATKLLRAGDTLLAVDGRPVRTLGKLHELIGAHRAGDELKIRFTRKGAVRNAAVRTVRDPSDPTQAVLGIFVEEHGGSVGKLPVHIKINTGNVGGPSAGLAFALELLEAFGRNVDRGYRVAATGQLELDGTVLPIGGVKQKTIGAEARNGGVDIFLVPAGANAREARKYAKGLKIIPVKSFSQALTALATLQPSSRMNG
jgi:PDZ domain-containing protein